MSTTEIAQQYDREQRDAERERQELALRREHEHEDDEERFDEFTGPWGE